jgi:hypothetical protein
MVQRRLDFRRVVQIECAAAAVAGSVAVALAWRGFGVTSLVVQLLLAAALETRSSSRRADGVRAGNGPGARSAT